MQFWVPLRTARLSVLLDGQLTPRLQVYGSAFTVEGYNACFGAYSS